MRFRSLRSTYALTGLLLGVSAPLGAFLCRLALFADVRAAPLADLATHEFFYSYQLAGTSIVFAIAGWLAGERVERLRRAEAFYHTLSEHDPLTGLYNARAFRDRYTRSLGRAERSDEPLSLILLDIDYLKRINDRYGHIVGNDALLLVAEAVRRAKRAEDSAARWGGDEFAILLTGGDAVAARRVADSVLQLVRERPLLHERGPISVSVTVGVCTAQKIRAGDDLFPAADRALYAGKRAGRDRVYSVNLDAAR